MTPTLLSSPPARRRASILVVVLITLVFATAALLLFIERASTDLMVHIRDADRLRLRQEAYSALETTLAVLVDFKAVLGALHSPAEGWSDPLEWVGYTPTDGMQVHVEFEDESGKLSVSKLDFQVLSEMFESWGERETDAQLWADAMLGWMKEDYTPESFDAPKASDYEGDPIGFLPPGRPLRSFQELRSIDVIREAFFNADGQLNERGRRFESMVSLFNFSTTNVNSAPDSVLAALGGYDEQQQSLLTDYRSGKGIYQGNGQGYFTTTDEIGGILGPTASTKGFGTEIQALRIRLTVTQGVSAYTLNVVIATGKGATLPAGDPIPHKVKGASTASDQAAAATAASLASRAAADPSKAARESAAKLAAEEVAGSEDAAQTDIEYPFTLLEIREIDAPQRLADMSQTEDN